MSLRSLDAHEVRLYVLPPPRAAHRWRVTLCDAGDAVGINDDIGLDPLRVSGSCDGSYDEVNAHSSAVTGVMSSLAVIVAQRCADGQVRY